MKNKPNRQQLLKSIPRAQGAIVALTLEQAQERTRRSPDDVHAWKEFARNLLQVKEFDEGRSAAQQACELAPQDAHARALLGMIELQADNQAVARQHFTQALELDENCVPGHQGMAHVLMHLNDNIGALHHIEESLKHRPEDQSAQATRAIILTRRFKYEEAEAALRKLIAEGQSTFGQWTNLGNIKRDLCLFEQAEECYRKAVELMPKSPFAHSNLVTLMHYMPTRTREDILAACKNWGAIFLPETRQVRPVPDDLSPDRRLRIGLFSDGFRQHPVGAMTTTALEHLDSMGVELYCYTTSPVVDHLTQRLMNISASWVSTAKMTDDQFTQRVRDDKIDILIDLAGHNAGTRMRSMAMEPAPLLVKWVGGLINTTGVDFIDYLITDSIESPPDSDGFYTEKLIRMPDDYICYVPPPKVPAVGPLPALKNGYITFGCFNNPTKINDVLLTEWARLMMQVPDSRLLLKSGPYESPDLRKRIVAIMAAEGVAEERVMFEGQSLHYDLFGRYNDIDVALDPWPYSGGLTTCEAMLMGVPVVSLPGPTFAGRHSATHLVNAGMAELVAQDWDQYRARALELVSDLQALATIRSHLRQILLESPICDGKKFAGHLGDALRAIWQRYCAGRKPAALAFTPDGQPWFEDDDAPTVVSHPKAQTAQEDTQFSFAFQGRIVTLDHGASMVRGWKYKDLARTKTLSMIVIDPASNTQDADKLLHDGRIQHYHTEFALGDGQPRTLNACLEASFSGTLNLLPLDQQPPYSRAGANVLARLPVQTVRLDAIEGLERIDWLILDDRHDSLAILRGAEGLMPDMLLVHARVMFMQIYQDQPDLSSLIAQMARYGMRLLRLDGLHHHSSLPAETPLKQPFGGSQLVHANALFVPDEARLATLEPNQLRKLAFLLHTVYHASDLAFNLLARLDEPSATRFLRANGLLRDEEPEASTLDLRNRIEVPAILLAEPPRKACVGVPVYNEEKYIEHTIRSLLAQDADDVGFLISDNASTDRTLEIVQDLTGGDSRFKLHRHDQNKGSMTNFTFAFMAAQSEYFMWLGGHDYLSPDYVSNAIKRLDENDKLSMVFGRPYSVHEGTIEREMPAAIYEFNSDKPAQRYLDSVVKLANCTIIHSMFRRAHLQDCDMRQTMSCDHVLISHLLWKGHLEYMNNGPKYFRRFFKQRAESAAERITGKKEALPASGLYRYYRDDIATLARSHMPPASIASFQHTVQQVLAKRFR
ncbi:Poly-beta-1%2C6-N-acetyl-D-glucosamine synthase [Bordetella ansorpii]|uniref:protein O-GlcNAc transferase n=1 Tax=Bordetella ansorpii TaxID=288768 RepID=A0A157SMB4_9BORD|nr:glycosyltransferase [Bordetella ansorpii]SAI71313.1 Poly-beta-1%2C6-N-acetyl-D-glucosamine synthase [Bordetella ansorpii]